MDPFVLFKWQLPNNLYILLMKCLEESWVFPVWRVEIMEDDEVITLTHGRIIFQLDQHKQVFRSDLNLKKMKHLWAATP